MVQSPSWEANWFAASKEIPRISRNPNVHYRTHKPPPLVPIFGQPNPVHIPTSHLLEIHPNIIHHLHLGLPSGFFPSGFPTKTLYTPPPHLYAPLTPYLFNVQSVIIFSYTPMSSKWSFFVSFTDRNLACIFLLNVREEYKYCAQYMQSVNSRTVSNWITFF